MNEQPYEWTPPSNLLRWDWRPLGADSEKIGHHGTAFVSPNARMMGFGEAVGSAVARANPSRPVNLIIVGRPSTAIANWLPDNSPDPDVYAALRANVEAALGRANDQAVDGFLWWQGERDGADGIPNYADKFDALHARLRQERWFPSSTPMVLMGVSILHSPGVSAMNIILAKLAAEEPKDRIFVNVADMPDLLWEDFMNNIHPTPAGYVEAGRLAAEALQPRLSCGH